MSSHDTSAAETRVRRPGRPSRRHKSAKLPTPRPAARARNPPVRPVRAVVQTLPADRVTDVVTRALPKGLRVADAGGQPGFGHLTVDDGRGRCLVAVTVQRWKPGDPDIGKVFGKARELPDGTRVLTSRAPSSKGGAHAVEWRADTLTTDGLRVLVSEVNARAYRLPGTRSTPVLSLDRLVRVARDPAWGEAAGSASPSR